ncbi:TPA: hypothetical protein ACNV46_001159 [Citrobacter freundii]|uniref:hypothetical protein n=1 Tax=Citrobacter sp. Cf072 TaxID=2985048 RepID=UPI001A23E162|nr:hypothetical protein [Citrobacter sp. Cf072]ELS5415973.1 hypothetical protein [Citrobacter freundii]EMA2416349.1 hypothetical protein [Citrobacter freundii]MDM3249826.1 hypothetical protein [Citrobacter sp. Cf072]HAT2187650.1 hypothetical protein [Citrobacter freundii]HAT2231236.1 hypothetical protein [Citrobacter freundii]
MKYTMKVYASSPEYGAYLKSRFGGDKSGQSFEWAGHRWAYEVTSFDDAGDYDLLYRFDDKPYPEEVSVTTDDMTIRDYFATAYMQGVAAKSGALYDRKDLANEAYQMADAMLRAREAS